MRFDNIYDVAALPAFFTRKQGKGLWCFLDIDLGDFYTINRSNTLRVFIKKMISNLGYTPAVSVSGSRFADLTVTEKAEQLIVNVINMAGEHNVPTCRSYNEIPMLGKLTITLDPSLGIKEVTPVTCVEYSVSTADGIVNAITLKSLHIHAAFICR